MTIPIGDGQNVVKGKIQLPGLPDADQVALDLPNGAELHAAPLEGSALKVPQFLIAVPVGGGAVVFGAELWQQMKGAGMLKAGGIIQ